MEASARKRPHLSGRKSPRQPISMFGGSFERRTSSSISSIHEDGSGPQSTALKESRILAAMSRALTTTRLSLASLALDLGAVFPASSALKAASSSPSLHVPIKPEKQAIWSNAAFDLLIV